MRVAPSAGEGGHLATYNCLIYGRRPCCGWNHLNSLVQAYTLDLTFQCCPPQRPTSYHHITPAVTVPRHHRTQHNTK
jgi:hypothetical protein